jgi:hypothetical protein
MRNQSVRPKKLKKKKLAFYLLGLMIVILDSCSPKVNSPDTTGLLRVKTGGRMTEVDSNKYVYSLPCNCNFELRVEGADTMSISYDIRDVGIAAKSHTITAFPRSVLAQGIYYSWLAIVTLKPDTKEDFRDTLRDTVSIVQPPVSLERTKIGGILTSMDTNIYHIALSCFCPFLLKVVGADTTSIHYDVSNFKDTISDHKI